MTWISFFELDRITKLYCSRNSAKSSRFPYPFSLWNLNFDVTIFVQGERVIVSSLAYPYFKLDIDLDATHHCHIRRPYHNAPCLHPLLSHQKMHNRRIWCPLRRLQYPGEIENNGFTWYRGLTRCIVVYVNMINGKTLVPEPLVAPNHKLSGSQQTKWQRELYRKILSLGPR